ncbi:LysR family transcriptional regulator [Bacillus chungangensis]|uniref:DNA-binding transcriptional LysR family regulator n=1 Tax=Bacillus chungangensis TaxID=587633 RepID=A0ABT9WP17_9BACI|nr:LysR family transcriptional regulator [Bacillus chungangensis]MDQ0174859.1 DNA-binding transcriptional LysR family regulator [Bacillus chungangensis]
MDIKDLIIFKTLATELNITKTAKKLHYVQSNVTSRIKKLESELGSDLIYRHARGVRLTPKGKIFLQYTDKILHLMNEAKKTIRDSEVPLGPLNIGANETNALVKLPHILAAYTNSFPKVDLSLHVGTTKDLIHLVLHHKLDGAFVVGPVNHPDLLEIAVFEDELVIIAHNKQPPIRSLKDMNKRTLLARPNCIHQKRLEQWLQDEGIYPEKRMELSTLESIIGCVQAGLGAAILTRSLVENDPKHHDLSCYKLPKNDSKVITVFIRRKNVYESAALIKLIDLVNVIT